MSCVWLVAWASSPTTTTHSSATPLWLSKLSFAMKRMSSDLDQQVDVNPVPLGIPEVWGDLHQQVDVTPVPLGIPRVRGRPPPPALSPSISSLSSPPPMWRMSSDLDQQVDVNPVPLGIPEVRGDLDQQVDVTPIPLGIPRVRGRPPPSALSPSLSSLSSPPPPDLVRRRSSDPDPQVDLTCINPGISRVFQLTTKEWIGCKLDNSGSKPFLWLQLSFIYF